MQKQLNRIINSIKEKTGVDIIAQSNDGFIEVGTFRGEVDFNTFLNFYGEIFQKDGFTYFNFTFGGVKYLCVIKGQGEIFKNYAIFIKDLIENSEPKEVMLSFDEQLLSIITGDASKSRTMHFISKYSIKNSNCFCMIITSQKSKAKEVCEFLDDYSSNSSDSAVSLDNDTCLFIKFTESEGYDEYRSPSDYARFIVRFLYEELGIKVKIFIGGFANNFANISSSYKQAKLTEQYYKNYGYKGDVCAYKDFALIKLTEEISQIKLSELLSAITTPEIKEVLNDEELLETAENFLSNDLNVSETSRVINVHRNTLMYRLDKIEKLTGLDIRKFNDALDFRLISILYKNK